MNEYIRQFYNEGLAITFYLKPLKFIKKYVKNKTLSQFLQIILKVIYTIVAITFALFMFKIKFPFL